MADDQERAREEAAGWLILLDDDPDDEARRAEFRVWLDNPVNGAAWESVCRTGALLADAGRRQDTARPADGRGGGRAERSWWSRTRLRRPAVLAGLALVCGLAALAPGFVRSLEADHATGTAEIRSVRLEDGSIVELGPHSAIRVDFSARERHVTLLSGEALFDVSRDPARPFRVLTPGTMTTVLGTRFEVAMLDAGTSVGVARGHVQVAAIAGGASYDLLAGDWVRIDKDGAAERASNMPGDLVAGPGPRLAVRNRPVAEVIERLRPWFAGRIVIADDSVGKELVTGVFDAADPAQALEAIVGPQGGLVLRVGPWLLIVAKG